MTLDTNNDTVEKTYEGEADYRSDEIVLEAKRITYTDNIGTFIPKHRQSPPAPKKKTEPLTFHRKSIDWRNFPRSHYDNFKEDQGQLVPTHQYMN